MPPERSTSRAGLLSRRTSASPDVRRSSQPELTVAAILLGLSIGCLLCFTNLYFGLQTGWISMMSLQSALLGFLLSRAIPAKYLPKNPQSLVIIQTTAVATGTMPLAAGFVGVLPAMGLLNMEQDGVPPVRLSWLGAVSWSCAVAFFGVFLSPPLRKRVIIEEKLPFPSGTATAQLISVLHRVPPVDPSLRHRGNGYGRLSTESVASPIVAYHALGPTDVDDVPAAAAEAELEAEAAAEAAEAEAAMTRDQGWSYLSWSFAASSAMTMLAFFFPVLFAIPLFGYTLAHTWLWTFTPSLSYVGQGIIMGFPTTLSMNLGMLVGWGILSPLSKHRGWAPGPVGDMATGARGWILWVALGTMCADSLASLAPVAWEFCTLQARALRRAAKGPADRRLAGDADAAEDAETETPERLVPMRWVAWGLAGSILLGTVLVRLVFGREGITSWATVIGFVLGSLLSVLGVRALGETDLNPVSGLGKISQLLFAVLQPGNVVANLVAGGVAEAGAQQAGDLMQDLKTGHLVGASPRAQFYGQLIGSAVSIVVTASAYTVYTRVYTIPSTAFPAPTAFVWLSLARLLRDGQLPDQSGTFMLIFGLLAAAASAAKTRATHRGAPYAKWLPSGVAFAIGFLNTPSFSLARLVGGLVEYFWRRRRGDEGGRDIRLIIVASGFVLGEGLVSVVSLGLKMRGIGVASCWGCGHGLCAGC